MRRLQGNNVLVRIGWKPDIREQNLLLSLFDCRWCYNTRAIIQAHSRMKLKSAQLYTKCKIFLSMRVLWFLVPQGHTYLSCWLCQGESVVSIIIQSSSVILSTLEPMGSTTTPHRFHQRLVSTWRESHWPNLSPCCWFHGLGSQIHLSAWKDVKGCSRHPEEIGFQGR